MTLLSPPGYLNNVATHTAQTDRMSAIVAGMATDAAGTLTWRDGCRTTADMAVAAQVTPNMSIKVDLGIAFVKGTQSATQGMYVLVNDASFVVNITAANAINGRNDLIIARVQDSFYSGSTNSATLEVVTGTAAATPADPAVPANSLILARVRVGANVTSINNAAIDDLRKFTGALGGVIPCLSTAQPAVGNGGTIIYETDTKLYKISNGVGYSVLSTSATNTSWTPTITGVSSTLLRAEYAQHGSLVEGSVSFTVTGAPTGAINVSLPPVSGIGNVVPGSDSPCVGSAFALDTSTPANNVVGTTHVGATSGIRFLSSGQSAFWGTTASNPFTWATGDTIRANFAVRV